MLFDNKKAKTNMSFNYFFQKVCISLLFVLPDTLKHHFDPLEQSIFSREFVWYRFRWIWTDGMHVHALQTSACPPAGKPASRPACRPAGKPASQQAGRPASRPAGRSGGSRDPPRRPTWGSGDDDDDDDDDDDGNDGNGNDDDEHPDANYPTCPRAQG